MISADMHSHTHFSHGLSSPEEMYEAARAVGLAILGFSEHSPRPLGYDYSREYRDRLAAGFDEYVLRVRALQERPEMRVLLGMEMDWLDGETEFIKAACAACDFDYIIGSVHFLGRWGFDDTAQAWEEADEKANFARYEHYFELWSGMLASGLFQIAAHPDLIKIFSRQLFHKWLERPSSSAQVDECLAILKKNGMAMEISSAGLRKPCREIYPCPAIMQLAAKRRVDITFASDAHCAEDVGKDFQSLASYAREFGFNRQSVCLRGQITHLPF